jgi:hypothetical protein
MKDKKNSASQEEKTTETPSKINKIYNAASNILEKDINGIKEDIVLPSVRLGKNRLVSSFMVAKTGAVIGLKVAGPYGVIKGAAAGAVVGLIGGPTAFEKIESFLDSKNENEEKKDQSSDKTFEP